MPGPEEGGGRGSCPEEPAPAHLCSQHIPCTVYKRTSGASCRMPSCSAPFPIKQALSQAVYPVSGASATAAQQWKWVDWVSGKLLGSHKSADFNTCCPHITPPSRWWSCTTAADGRDVTITTCQPSLRLQQQRLRSCGFRRKCFPFWKVCGVVDSHPGAGKTH